MFATQEYKSIQISVQIETLLLNGIEELLNGNYNEALNKFKTIKQNLPNEPLGYLLSAITLQTENEDYQTLNNSKIIESNLEKAIALSEKKLENINEEKDGIYYYALSNALSCLLKLKKGFSLDAITDGFSAFRNYSKVINKYPDFIEPYSGYSAAQYWQAKRFPLLSPFSVEKQKQAGIDGLKKVYQNSKLEKYFALHYLIWILIEEKKYDEALSLIKENQLIHPKNRLYIRAKMTIYSRANNSEKLIDASKELLESILESKIRNPHSEISALNNILKNDISNKSRSEIINYGKNILQQKCQNNHSACNSKLQEIQKYINQHSQKEI